MVELSNVKSCGVVNDLGKVEGKGIVEGHDQVNNLSKVNYLGFIKGLGKGGQGRILFRQHLGGSTFHSLLRVQDINKPQTGGLRYHPQKGHRKRHIEEFSNYELIGEISA